jgi:DNA-binding NarL/FixJ family response regulator
MQKTIFMHKVVKKIFVVDDDEMLSMALEDYLERKTDHEVHLFNTGEDCLDHIQEQPDIVILDYNLNSVKKDAANGLVILDAIKKLNDNIQIVMLSSQDASWIIMQTVQMGAAEYVVKDENAFEKIRTFCETAVI